MRVLKWLTKLKRLIDQRAHVRGRDVVGLHLKMHRRYRFWLSPVLRWWF